MSIKTPLCDLLEIEYPVLQAGMGQIAHGALAGAVSAAGGLGVIGAGYMSAEELQAEISVIRAQTDKPFGVDILFGKVETDDQGSAQYAQRVQDQIAVSLEAQVPVLISGLGSPEGVIDAAHARGVKVMSVVGNVRQARRVVEYGVDAVIASGAEGGGHVGRVGTVSLVPQVVDAIDVPVIAGGGLADGRGLVASLALGAMGMWLGTRFIVTDEARGHINYKTKIAETDEEGTIVSKGHSGKPCRLIRNDFTAYWEGHASEIKPYPQQLLEVGEPATILGRIDGDVGRGVLPAGQSSGLITHIQGAGSVVLDIVSEAEKVLANLTSP
jgi:enoyl-[acyl-carrier protein] reductase II